MTNIWRSPANPDTGPHPNINKFLKKRNKVFIFYGFW